MLSPILEKLSTDASVKSGSGLPLDLVTVDTDSEIELAQKYQVNRINLLSTAHDSDRPCLFQIRSLPTVIAFKNGEPVSQFMGALPEPHVRRFIEQV